MLRKLRITDLPLSGLCLGTLLLVACGKVAPALEGDTSADPARPETPPDNSAEGDTSARPPRPEAPPDNLPEGMCNPFGWCWVEPRPFGEVLSSLHGTPDGQHLFAAATSGVVLEYGAGSWKYHDEVRVREPSAVHVVSHQDVWVGGREGLWHFDGAGWSETLPGEVGAVVRTGDERLWATVQGRLYVAEGGGWRDVLPDPDIWHSQLVAGPGDAELWMLSFGSAGRSVFGILFHFDGSTWTESRPDERHDDSGATLFRWNDDVYVRSGNRLYHVSPDWELITSVGAENGIWLLSDGTAHGPTPDGVPLALAEALNELQPRSLWATDAGEVWLGLAGGGAARLDAQGEALPIAATPEDPPVVWEDQPWGAIPVQLWAGPGAWGSGPNDVWRIASGGMEHFDGTEWRGVVDGGFYGVYGSGTDDVWFVNFSAWVPQNEGAVLLQWTGEELVERLLPEPGFGVQAVHSFGANDTWVAAFSDQEGRLWHFDGGSWQTIREFDVGWWGAPRTSISGRSSQDLWMLVSGELLHFDGTSWRSPLPLEEESLSHLVVDAWDVWAFGPDNAYVQTADGFRAEPLGGGTLGSVALTDQYIWTYDVEGRVARKRR